MTRQALIVAHGQPSDPAGPEAEIAALAADVGAVLPDWQIKGATLASPGALEAAIAGMNAPRIFPFFMSDGWFIRENLPGRLEAAGYGGLHILTPFGLLAGAHKLAQTMAIRAAAAAHWTQTETVLVLAAHGSGRSPHPAIAAREIADEIGVHTAFRAIRVGFIEEEPHLADVLRGTGPCSLLLPLFVARWGHVIGDIPKAVEVSGFKGRVLPPLGQDAQVPKLIADAIVAAA